MQQHQRQTMISIRITTLFTLITLLSACSTLLPPFEPSAFGADKTYALITIVSAKDVEGDDTTTLRGAASSDAFYYFPARPALKASVNGLEKALSGHSAWRLLPPQKLKNHPAWRKVKQEKLPDNAILAPGYRFLTKPASFAKLAQELNVDGVILLKVDFHFKFYGQKLTGIAASGKTNPVIKVDLRFLDRSGKIVYRTTGTKTWNEGAPARDEAANPKLMYPLLSKAAVESVRVISQRLDNRLAKN